MLKPGTTQRQVGLTIVELLIVIIVVAILATMVVVVFGGMTRRATESGIKQDLTNANKEVEIYRATNGALPTANNCLSPTASEICLKGSASTTITYVTDGSNPPSGYTLLASNGDVHFLSQNGSAPSPSYGGRFVTLTNMFQNGDFSSGSNSWGTAYCGSGSVRCVFDNSVATLIAESASRTQISQIAPGPYTDGDKVYYSARIRKDSGSNMTMTVHRPGGGFAHGLMSTSQFNAAPQGTFVRYSGIRTFYVSQGVDTHIMIGDFEYGKIFQAAADDAVAINLTSSFGAGNEPTVSEMDSILGQFVNGWFSGTVTATY